MWRIFLQNPNSQLPPPFLPIHRPSLYPYSLSPLMMRCQKEVEGSIQNCINDSFWSTVANYLLKMNWKFIMLKFKSESNPLDLGSMLWPSWHVIHHIKPTQGGYLEVKGFQDPSTYGWEKYHITLSGTFGHTVPLVGNRLTLIADIICEWPPTPPSLPSPPLSVLLC